MARIRTTDDAGRVFNAYSPVFTLKHNAVRAARKALGAHAQPNADFALEENGDGWTWRANLAGAEHAPSAPVSIDHNSHEAPPKTVEELLRRIAIEHNLEGARLIIQALHTAFAEGTVSQRSNRRYNRRRPLYLFNERLTDAA